MNHVVWTTEIVSGGSIGVNANFAEIWLTLTCVFVPAWVVGVVAATRKTRRTNSSNSQESTLRKGANSIDRR